MTDSLLQCLIHSAAFLEHLTLHSLVCVCMCLVMSDSLQPCGLSPNRLFCPWDFSGKNTGVGCHFLPQGDLPNPGIKPASPALAGRFFTIEPLGKPIFLYLFFFIFKILGCAKQNGKSQVPDQGSHPLPAPPTPLH